MLLNSDSEASKFTELTVFTVLANGKKPPFILCDHMTKYVVWIFLSAIPRSLILTADFSGHINK